MLASTEISAAARRELAPGGTLRVGINFGGELIAKRDSVTRTPGGISVELAWELGRRMGTPVEIVPYEAVGEMADCASKGAWDVAFLGIEPERAVTIDFSPPYLEIDSTYMVRPGSSLHAIADIDREGVRVVLAEKSAYDLHLSRTIAHATLVRVQGGGNAAFGRFVADQELDALALLRPVLVRQQRAYPDARILDGRFAVARQAAGVPKGRHAGLQYLSAYIEEVKAEGKVARAIESNGIKGVSVAPAAS